MAMNYAWQERKKFAIPVAAGAGVLLIWYVFVLSSLNGATDRHQRDRKTAEMHLRSRMQAGVPTDVTVGQADRDQKRFQEDLKTLRDELEFRVDQAFKVKEGESTAGKFGRQRQDVYTKVNDRAKAVGWPQVDSKLGFPQSFNDLTEPVLAEWLIRLAVVQRIYMHSIDSGVSELKLLEVVTESPDPTITPEKFMGVLAIKFRVTGTAEAILKVCHGLQQKGPSYLALESAEINSSNPTQNLLSAVLTVGALVVRPEGALIVEAKP